MAEQFVYGGSEQAVAQAASLKFGLNKNAVILSIKYTDDCRGENSSSATPIEACDITFAFGDKEFSHRIMPPKGVYVKGQLDDSPAGFKKALIEQVIYPLGHVMEGLGVTTAQINAAIALLFSNPLVFKTVVEKFIGLLPKNYATIKLDLFLQYEGSLREGATRTYLKLHKDLRSGLFVVPAMEGEFTEVRKVNATKDDPKALYYVREDRLHECFYGAEHRFVRNGYFVNSGFAKLQEANGTTFENAEVSSADIQNLKY